ncbi:MAG: hypothetical protein J6T16_02210, partial [Opitutales bacterium]|nr:hypothetical protein [Opitutales bacterium]
EIYKRGFLRLYAAYLGLDPKTIMESYFASTGGRLSDRESKRAQDAKKQFMNELNDDSSSTSPENRYDDEPDADIDPDSQRAPDNSKYMKIGAIILGVAAAIILIVSVVSKLSGGAKTPAADAAPAESYAENFAENDLTIMANADTPMKLVSTSNPNYVYFDGELKKGEVKTVKMRENLIIRLPKGKIGDLRIERNGNFLDFANLLGADKTEYQILLKK